MEYSNKTAVVRPVSKDGLVCVATALHMIHLYYSKHNRKQFLPTQGVENTIRYWFRVPNKARKQTGIRNAVTDV